MQFPRTKRMTVSSLLGLVVPVCLGCNSPVDPPPPPGGGSEYVLDFAMFESSAYPVLRERGCDAGGDCHGGGIRGTLELSPPDDKDVVFDFVQVSLQVDGLDPAASRLLTKPLVLEAGGEPHSFKAFSSTEDAGYQALLDWIESGEFQP